MTNKDTDPVPHGGLDWGGLRRNEPISDRWGFDRGQPIDRYYIEAFLASQSQAIRGACLEVMNPDYLQRFGRERVVRADVLDVNARNPKATVVGDLLDPATLASGAYDCIVLTQTLQVLFDPGLALRNCYSALAPGGVMLVTVPCLCRYSPHPVDYWRFTGSSLGRLLAENTGGEISALASFGNLVASIAFLEGLASSELDADELDRQDERFPIVAVARVDKR